MQQSLSVRLAPLFVAVSRRGVAGVLACAVLAAGGCKSTGQQPSAGPGKQGEAAPKSKFPVVHEDWAKMGYRLDWVSFPFLDAPPRGKVVHAQAFDDVFVVQDRNSTVSVLETATGKVRWSLDLAGPLTKFVGLVRDPQAPDHLFVASESEIFTLSLTTSNLIGRESLEMLVNTRPVMANGLAIFGTPTGEVYAQLLGRRVKAWGFQMHGSIEADPVVMGDTLGFVSQGEDVCFLTTQGVLLGRARIYGPVANSPVTDGASMFIAGEDQSVWAFDPGGTRVWRHRTASPLRAQPAVLNGVLYVDVPGSGLVALDPATGAVKWTCKDVSNGTVVETRNGRLLAWTGHGLALVDPASGDVVEQVSTPGVSGVYVDGSADANIYAVSDRGVAAKFIPR